MSDFMEWVAHGIKRGKFETTPRAVMGAVLFVVVTTVIAATYLTLVSRTSAHGRHIEQLRAELMTLRRENQQLETEVASEIAISRLFERASELGFELAEEVDYLPIPTSE